MKYVAWKVDNKTWKVTSAENYNSRIMDLNKVMEVRDCYNFYDAKQCAVKWLGATEVQEVKA